MDSIWEDMLDKRDSLQVNTEQLYMDISVVIIG